MHYPAGLAAAHSPLIDAGSADADEQLKFSKHKPVWNESDTGEPDDGQRYSTWPFIEKGLRGPKPYPHWLIEDAAAIDTELGILKTGKEGDVFLLERATEDRSSILAAKRYRSREQMQFSRSQAYSDGRSARRSRDNRAIRNNSTYGKQVAALQWANAEWTYLLRCYEAGIPVPYPVQIDGTEILMEFIADPEDQHAAAPRLQQLSRFDPRLPALWDQLVDALERFAGLGVAHGDLSAYNLLVSGERLVVIDVPQCVDLAGNPNGLDFLHRDCVNLCEWFASKGLPNDPDELFSSLLSHLF